MWHDGARPQSLCTVSVWQRQVGAASLTSQARLPSVDAQAAHMYACLHARMPHAYFTCMYTQQYTSTGTFAHMCHTQRHFRKEENFEGGKPLRWLQPALGSRASEKRTFLDYWDLVENLPSGVPLHLLWSPGTLDSSSQSPEQGRMSALEPPKGLHACLWPRLPTQMLSS